MVLWLAFAAMAALAVGFVIVPLLRRHHDATAPARADYDLVVYKDQLREIERDRARGVLDEEQAAAARLEIERRLLAAVDADAPAGAPPSGTLLASGRARWPFALVIALILIPAAGLIYLQQGAPWLAGVDDRSATREREAQQQFATMIGQLEQRLAEVPDDRRGWVLLARGYVRLGRMAEAEAAQQRALALTPDDGEAAEIAAGFGQILVEESQGAVSPSARAAFADALKRNPAQPQARYFMGLAKLQAGDTRGALADWQSLLADAPPDAPWHAGLADQVSRLQGEQAAAPAAPDDPAAPQAMIESMVAGLAARLDAARESGGGTAMEWAQLGRSYRVLGRPAQARDAYAEAVKRAPDDAALWRDYAAAVAAADGESSAAHTAALRQLRDRLPDGSPERAAIDAQLKQ